MPTRPITVVLNCSPDAREKTVQDISEAFASAGLAAQVITLDEAEAAVKRLQGTTEPVVAAGGDGTVNAVANLCYKYGVTLGVIPFGTFNYFARERGLTADLAENAQVIAAGHTEQVAAGLVGDQLFLNNASFGLYTKIIRQREKASARFGRARVVAAISAIHSLLLDHKLFTIKVNSGASSSTHRTSMVFVGNNTLQLENLGLNAADCAKNDQLAMILMKEISKWRIGWLVLLSIVRNLSYENKLVEMCADNFEIETPSKKLDLVVDGEIIRCATPLRFKSVKAALTTLVPMKKANA